MSYPLTLLRIILTLVLATSVIFFSKANCEAPEMQFDALCDTASVSQISISVISSCGVVLCDYHTDKVFRESIISYLEKQVNSPPAIAV